MQEMIMIFLNDFSVLPQTEMFYKVKKNVMFVPNFTVSPIRPQLDRYGPLDNLVRRKFPRLKNYSNCCTSMHSNTWRND